MSRMSLATMAVLPTSVWMRMYAVTTVPTSLPHAARGALQRLIAEAMVACGGHGHWRLAPVPRSSLGVASGEMPASPGAITNSGLLLLLLLVLPGFFELLTQREVLLGEKCLAGCLA